jgi:hypothetical protein
VNRTNSHRAVEGPRAKRETETLSDQNRRAAELVDQILGAPPQDASGLYWQESFPTLSRLSGVVIGYPHLMCFAVCPPGTPAATGH